MADQIVEYGILGTVRVELPPASPEEAAQIARDNERLARMGMRMSRGGLDYAFGSYDKMSHNMSYSARQKKAPRPAPERLPAGSLVRIFNTVSQGEILWQGDISFDYKQYHHGLQRDMDPQLWSRLFRDNLPARLIRDGRTIFGCLEPFSETGTEGVIWSVQAYKIAGYGGLCPLRDGDNLTIYSNVRKGDITWQGYVNFGPEKLTRLGWNEVVRTATHMDAKKWLELCYSRPPVALLRP